MAKKSAKKKTKSKKKIQKRKSSRDKAPSKPSEGEKIVIDESRGLVFDSEEALYEHFKPVIQKLEETFFSARKENDIAVDQFPEFEECLPMLLEEPFEIWQQEKEIEGLQVVNYVGEFEDEESPEADPIYYVAQVHLTEEMPSFVYLHFPTTDEELVDEYRKGHLIFDQSRVGLLPGALEGDALSEGDELAVGLYQAMLKVRGSKDIEEKDFSEFIELREETIEEADEIWQSIDLQGNVLVNFVKEFSDVEIEGYDESELYYIVSTVEEGASQTHALLFSFPTVDRNLVDRYRHGENLQAEEVEQQANH